MKRNYHVITLVLVSVDGESCTIYCKLVVLKKIPKCGHYISLPCGKDINAVLCEKEVNKSFLNCEHSIVLPCSILMVYTAKNRYIEHYLVAMERL